MFDNLAKFDLKYIYFLLGEGERGRGGGGMEGVSLSGHLNWDMYVYSCFTDFLSYSKLCFLIS